MEKIRVFLSDHQVLFREGIHFTLSGEDDFEVMGETTNNEDAYLAIETNPPTVAILSMHNTRLDGPTAAQRIRRNHPSVAVILVTENASEDEIFNALKSGASACITKDSDPNFLLETLRGVTQGNQPIVEGLLLPEVAAKTLAEFEDITVLSEQLDNTLASLSPKEREILGLLAAGSSQEQAIAKLNINEAGLRRHLREIVNKLLSNEQAKVMLQAAQRSMSGMVLSNGNNGKHGSNYVTRQEFNEFKVHLMERLKSFIGELT